MTTNKHERSHVKASAQRFSPETAKFYILDTIHRLSGKREDWEGRLGKGKGKGYYGRLKQADSACLASYKIDSGGEREGEVPLGRGKGKTFNLPNAGGAKPYESQSNVKSPRIEPIEIPIKEPKNRQMDELKF